MYRYANLVTILESSSTQHKSWALNEDSEFVLLDKQFSKYHTFNEVAILDITDIYSLVEKYSFKRNSCFVRGKMTEHAYSKKLKGYKVRRLVSERIENNVLLEATIQDYPKNWLMLDIDNFPTPQGTVLNVKSHREKAVECFISTLDESFHNVSYVCQFSNGMFLNSKKIKAHLWFMLNESYDCATLKPWFEKHCVGVDRCVFRPAQILYTSNPKFVNTSDPLSGNRIYLKEKANEKVHLPKNSVLREYLKELKLKKETLYENKH